VARFSCAASLGVTRSLRKVTVDLAAVQTTDKLNRIALKSYTETVVTHADTVEVFAPAHFFDVGDLA